MKAVIKLQPGVGHVGYEETPTPSPAAGQVLIEVKAAGICGTDLHIYHGEFKTAPPVVLGHEVAGRVVERGKGVERPELGARVTTETYFSTCGTCRYCRDGAVNLCLARRSIGSAVNGGFAPYLVVPASNLHRLPDTLDLNEGALTEPLACVVHAVLSTPTVAAGDVAVIAGPGTIGLLTLQVVKAAGAKVVVLGARGDEGRLELAAGLGADLCLNVTDCEAAEAVDSLTEGGGADVVYECSGAGAAASALLRYVRRKGRYVQVGLFGKAVSWDLDQVCYKELTVTGSNASTPASWRRAVQLLASGTVQPAPLITHHFPLSAWRDAFTAFQERRGVKLLLVPEDDVKG